MRRTMRLSVWLPALLLLLLGALTAPAGAQSGEYRLTILHTGENHGHWDVFTQTVPMGGIAQRATLVKRVRAEGGNVLLLDSGDVSQGTLYFTQHRLTEGAAFYNAVGYDAVGIGNHEFDFGPRTFAENWVAKARFSIVSSDLNFDMEPLLAGKIPSFVVKTVGGERIGILGFTTSDVTFNSALGPTVRVKPRVVTARAVVDQLHAQGINKIIALSHLGYSEDLVVAAAMNGIAVIVSGHTPTLLGDPAKLNPALGTPVGPYPAVVRSPSGKPVLVVGAADWGKLLGRLDVTFAADGTPTKWSGEPIFVDGSVPPDPEVEALRQQLAAPLAALRQAVIGKAAADLDGSAQALRSQEMPLGNLVADAMLDATRSDGAQVALMNGGGIRSGFKAGDVTLSQVLEALPFGNRLVQFDLRGATLLAALENGVSRISDGAGRFPQVAGMRFAYSLARPAGQRVTSVEIGSSAVGYKPLVPTAVYRIVTNDFVAGGGDGYDMFKDVTSVRGGDVLVDGVVADYIRAHGTVAPQVEGRIVRNALAPALPPAQASAAVSPAAAPATPTLPVAASPGVAATASPTPVPAAAQDGGDATLIALGVLAMLVLLAVVAYLIRRAR